MSLVSEFPRQLDERNRFILPAKLRENMSGTVYIARSTTDKCLNLYTEEEWEVIAQKVRELPTGTDRNAAMFQRRLFGKAMSYVIDSQGRIPLTQELVDFAGLKKDIVLVGTNSRVEIWDIDRWNDANVDVDDDYLVEQIKQFNINL